MATGSLLSCEPEVRILTVAASGAQHGDSDIRGDLLILACDGVWDVLSPADVSEVREEYARYTRDILEICARGEDVSGAHPYEISLRGVCRASSHPVRH